MKSVEPLADLLTRLKRRPRDADMEELAEVFASEATTEKQRCLIREAASTSRELMFALEAWGRDLSEADPQRYLRLHVAIISMCDGWPDSRDAFLMAKELLRFAEQHGGGCESLLRRLVALSTPRVQHLFQSPTLNMTLWSC